MQNIHIPACGGVLMEEVRSNKKEKEKINSREADQGSTDEE
jgi:hypothetical protein